MILKDIDLKELMQGKKIIDFKINEKQIITINNLYAENNLFYRYNTIQIFFSDGSNEYLLFQDDLIAGIDIFNYLLKIAILSDLKLHESIRRDIGFLWQENLHMKPNPLLTYEKLEGRNSWVGKNYLLWCSKYYTTWLFNKNDSIVFEIAPEYMWHSIDPEEGENFIEYEKWIKKYIPTKIIYLEQKTVRTWLAQTEFLLAEIEKADNK